MHCISGTYKLHGAILAAVMSVISATATAEKAAGDHAIVPKIALLGDSMTWIGGDSCQNDTGWSHVLKESGIAGDIDVYARSGATWTNTRFTKADTAFYSEKLHDNNVVYNQALRLMNRADSDTEKKPDAIVIFAGANDVWFSKKRPGIFGDQTGDEIDIETAPSSVTSLSGSVQLVCGMLNDRFPDADVILVTPIEMSKAPAEETREVSDIIERAAEQCEASVIRADREVDIRQEEEEYEPRYTYDGVHTNPEGAKLLGQYLVESIKEIITNTNPSQTMVRASKIRKSRVSPTSGSGSDL